jgi:hypothetical protein
MQCAGQLHCRRTIRFNTSGHLEKGLKFLVAVPRSDKHYALGGITLNEPPLEMIGLIHMKKKHGRTFSRCNAGPIRSHPEGVSAAGLQPSSLSNPLMSCAKAAMPSVIDQIPSSRRALIAMLRSVARI